MLIGGIFSTCPPVSLRRLCFATATLWPQHQDLVYQVWRVLLLTCASITPSSSQHSSGNTGRQNTGLTPENVDPTAACLVTFVHLESLLQAVAMGEDRHISLELALQGKTMCNVLGHVSERQSYVTFSLVSCDVDTALCLQVL